MLITTFNVNSVRSRLPILTRWLGEHKPDLLFLQETKTQDNFFPEQAFSELGYKSYYHGEKSYNGVAVLVKDGLEDITVTFGLDGEHTTRALTLKHKALTILNTYVPQGKELSSPSYTEKKAFLGQVRKVIEREHDGLFLWLGDLNVAPEAIDVTNPSAKSKHVCFCAEIRDIFQKTREGLTDLLRHFHPEAGIYTFYDYRVKGALERGIGWRIDHMLASKKLAILAESCFPDISPRSWEKPSDHVPLSASFGGIE